MGLQQGLVVLAQQGNTEYKENYEEYLQSDDWKEKRLIALKAADYRCTTCGKKRKLQSKSV